MMISGKHCTGMAAMVISCDKILLLVMDEHGIAHIMVFPPTGIHPVLIEIHIVERLVCHRPVCKPVLAVESHEFRTLRKTNLVIFIHESGDIGPIEE